MLLSKRKKKIIYIKSKEDGHHFYLDEEEEDMAFQAKIQLQQCSKEICGFQDQSCNQIQKQALVFNLRDSALTKATENQGVSVRSSSNSKHKDLRKNRIMTASEAKNKPVLNSTKYEPLNFVTFQNILCPKIIKQNVQTNRHISRVLVSSDKNNKRLDRFSNITRSKSYQNQSNNERDHTQRLHSSKRKRDFIQATKESRPYNFNDTISGGGKSIVNQLRQKNIKLSFQKLETEPNEGQLSVKLRPQFLKLLTLIKQKEERRFSIKTTVKSKTSR